jgi:hypothetical protein
VEQIFPALLNLVGEAYPQLPKLTDYGKWIAGEFTPPCVFLHLQPIAETPYSLSSNRRVYAGLIAIHFAKDEAGIYQEISTAPLTSILGRERYQYPTYLDGKRIVLNIDRESLHFRLDERGDRVYVTFETDEIVKIYHADSAKIETFQIETGG